MEIGDNLHVRSSARRARIIEDHGHSRYRGLFYSDPAVDALDRETIEDEDDAGGIYDAEDLDVIRPANVRGVPRASTRPSMYFGGTAVLIRKAPTGRPGCHSVDSRFGLPPVGQRWCTATWAAWRCTDAL